MAFSASHYVVTLLLFTFATLLNATAAPKLSGWKMTWSDDFSGSAHSPPSSSKWIIDVGTSYPGGAAQWGTGEIETYTSETRNVHVKNGLLYITPYRNEQTGAWTSGRIETRRSDFHAPPNGKMKIAARLAVPNVSGANGEGYWPAFWTLGADFRGNYTNWPDIGEFDIMEIINGRTETAATLHCGLDPGGPCNEPTGISGTGYCRGSSGCGAGTFHTYSVEVDRTTRPESLRFYTDGKLINEITSQTVGKKVWNHAVHEGRYILLNVAMGGAYPNAVAGYTTPTSATVGGKPMKVKYVAVYTQRP